MRQWHTLTQQEISAHFQVESNMGLSSDEARKQFALTGPNRLHTERRETLWEKFLEEAREPMILLLLVTGVFYAIWGGLTDALTIFFVILTMVGVEVFNEYRAEQTIAALRRLAEPTTPVRRDGRSVEIPTDIVVPGDILLLQVGRRVPADARLLEAYGLAVEEASLTGESTPIEKEADQTFPAQTALAERHNLVFAGTVVTRGRGTAIVVASGMATELGKIADLARQVRPPRTPLQLAMKELTRWLVWLALGFSTIVPILGLLLGHQSIQQMVLTGLSLAFATIPEEMPIIITIVLALGGYRLSRQQAIVKRLRAVETLGATTIIATDKTGTLTQNRMEVQRLYPQKQEHRLLKLGILCNDATVNQADFTGDPLDVALLRFAYKSGMDIQALRGTYSLRDEFTFDTTRKRMSMVYQHNAQLWIAVKGAPEAVLAQSIHRIAGTGEQLLSEEKRQHILETAAQMAADGMRVIAFAEKLTTRSKCSQEEAEADLTFIGLAGLADSPRSEAREAINACHGAGIRPLMITGDHPLTAWAIAQQVGLDGNARPLTGPELDTLSDQDLEAVVTDTSIYARTTPEHKLRIVQALRNKGHIVAVTGDGTNDAPALAAADIGIAMGETGSDVARESADIVLADNNFATIVRAIKEGRVLFANLKKGVRYYLACKVALISATLLPVLLFVPVPFAPIQIILMELFMDLAAAATFVAEPAESDLMRQPPRDPRTPFMDRTMVGSIFSGAIGLFAAVTLTYLITWYSSENLAKAQTIAFITWLIGHFFLALNLRSEREPLVRLGLFSNRLMIAWAVATVAFVLLVTLVPGVQGALKTTSLSGREWLFALGAAFVGTFWIEGKKLLFWQIIPRSHTKEHLPHE